MRRWVFMVVRRKGGSGFGAGRETAREVGGDMA